MSKTSPTPSPAPGAPEPDKEPGLLLGGQGGPEHELLEDGQEEVFSRYEVEHGLIEHHTEAGGFGMEPRVPEPSPVSHGAAALGAVKSPDTGNPSANPVVEGHMKSPLQSKDDNWRSRPNGATPVADPGLSMPGTDEEAGGAPHVPAATDGAAAPSRTPLPASPGGSGGLRLTPLFWCLLAGGVALVFIVAAVLSF